VCLDEVSALVMDQKSAEKAASDVSGQNAKFTPIYLAENKGAHLNTLILARVDQPSHALTGAQVADGLPRDNWAEFMVRNAVKVTIQFQSKTTSAPGYIYFMHANASEAGGKKAFELADSWCRGKGSSKGLENCAFVGDFNYKLSGTEDLVKQPIVDSCNFTQWTKSTAGQQAGPPIPGKTNLWYTAGGMIDFAFTNIEKNSKQMGRALEMAAIDSLHGLSTDQVGDVMNDMDHFPIAYDLSL
jgi:hypothetical protein